MDKQKYEDLIFIAEHRIGSFIASGGNSEDRYVKEQIQKIRKWNNDLAEADRLMGKTHINRAL